MGLSLESEILHIFKIMKGNNGVNMNLFVHFSSDISHRNTSLRICLVTYQQR